MGASASSPSHRDSQGTHDVDKSFHRSMPRSKPPMMANSSGTACMFPYLQDESGLVSNAKQGPPLGDNAKQRKNHPLAFLFSKRRHHRSSSRTRTDYLDASRRSQVVPICPTSVGTSPRKTSRVVSDHQNRSLRRVGRVHQNLTDIKVGSPAKNSHREETPNQIQIRPLKPRPAISKAVDCPPPPSHIHPDDGNAMYDDDEKESIMREKMYARATWRMYKRIMEARATNAQYHFGAPPVNSQIPEGLHEEIVPDSIQAHSLYYPHQSHPLLTNNHSRPCSFKPSDGEVFFMDMD